MKRSLFIIFIFIVKTLFAQYVLPTTSELTQYKKAGEQYDREMSPARQGRIFLEGNISLAFESGEVFKTEQSAFSLTVQYEDGTIKTANPNHVPYGASLSLEYLIANNFGLVLGYNGRSVEQDMLVGDKDYKNPPYYGTYLEYSAIASGFNWHVYANRRSTLYLTGRYNYVMNGALHPFPAAMKYYNLPQFNEKMTGWFYTIGFGSFAFMKHFFVGVNFFYNKAYFKTEQKIYTNIDENFSCAFFDLIVSMGFFI